MKIKKKYVLVILLLIISCLTFYSCKDKEKEDLDSVAVQFWKGANSAFVELDEIDASFSGVHVISSNPKYNLCDSDCENEENIYKFYDFVQSYFEADNYEYLIELEESYWGEQKIRQLYIAESWKSKKISGYPVKPASVEWPPKCEYLTDDFSTLKDIADEVGTYSIYTDNSPYGHKHSKSNDSIFELQDFNYNDLLDEIIELCGDWAFRIFLIVFIISIVWCFFGYEVYHIFVAINIFLIMFGTGVIAAIANSSLGLLMFFVVLGIILAVVCINSKSFCAFILGILNSYLIASILSALIVKDLQKGMIIGFVFSIIIGIITAIFKKPLIILSSAIGYGSSAGIALACMIPKTEYSTIFQVLFIAGGFCVQTIRNKGLLEGGSLIAYIKGNKSEIKENTTSDYEINEAKDDKIKPILMGDSGKKCTSCGALMAMDSHFCIKCGAKFEIKTETSAPAPKAVLPKKVKSGKKCKVCGALMAEDSHFCTECGASFEVKTETAEPATKTVLTKRAKSEKKCTICGALMPDDSHFCIECGAKFGVDKPDTTIKTSVPVEKSSCDEKVHSEEHTVFKTDEKNETTECGEKLSIGVSKTETTKEKENVLEMNFKSNKEQKNASSANNRFSSADGFDD